MIGPQNLRTVCAHGHENAMALYPREARPGAYTAGWEWSCKACRAAYRRKWLRARGGGNRVAQRVQERTATILDMRGYGFTEDQIAKELGVHPAAHQRWCYRHGLPVIGKWVTY